MSIIDYRFLFNSIESGDTQTFLTEIEALLSDLQNNSDTIITALSSMPQNERPALCRSVRSALEKQSSEQQKSPEAYQNLQYNIAMIVVNDERPSGSEKIKMLAHFMNQAPDDHDLYKESLDTIVTIVKEGAGTGQHDGLMKEAHQSAKGNALKIDILDAMLKMVDTMSCTQDQKFLFSLNVANAAGGIAWENRFEKNKDTSDLKKLCDIELQALRKSYSALPSNKNMSDHASKLLTAFKQSTTLQTDATDEHDYEHDYNDPLRKKIIEGLFHINKKSRYRAAEKLYNSYKKSSNDKDQALYIALLGKMIDFLPDTPESFIAQRADAALDIAEIFKSKDESDKLKYALTAALDYIEENPAMYTDAQKQNIAERVQSILAHAGDDPLVTRSQDIINKIKESTISTPMNQDDFLQELKKFQTPHL